MRRALAQGPRSIAFLALALSCSACISFRFQRVTVNSPIADARLHELHAGSSTLGECLATLGAPVFAWERPEGFALAWGWTNDQSRGVTISVPLDQGQSASASYDDVARRLSGVVLFFDEELHLRDLRRGFLDELRKAERARPPAPPEATAQEG